MKALLLIEAEDPRSFLRNRLPYEDKARFVRLAIQAAELVLPIFTSERPKDTRPAKAIQAAKNWLENPCEETVAAAYAAAYAAAAYAHAAYAAYAANAAATAQSGPEFVAKINAIKTEIQRLRGIREAEDPKSILRQLSHAKIWPSENYYLNIWKPTESWAEGNFTPCQVNEHNELMTFDATYGIMNDIYAVLGVTVNRDPTEQQEERCSQEVDNYWNLIHDALKQGITFGEIDGIAGPYNWQLVYDPSQVDGSFHSLRGGTWTRQLQKVKAGHDYGPRISPKQDRSRWKAFGGDIDPNDPNLAESLARAVLNGESPKNVFKRMQGPEPLFLVKVATFNRNQRTWRDVGSFTVNADTRRVLSQRWAPYFNSRPTPEDIRHIVTSLHKYGSAMAGYYPRSDPWPGRFHWEAEYVGDISRHRPMLVVEGPGWTVQGPLLKNTEHGDYIWRFRTLTPEQHHILKQFGEFIHYAMNEGSEFRGKLDNEETWNNTFNDDTPGYTATGPTRIQWRVVGNPDFAPEGSWGKTDWSGLAPNLP